jgi:anaerobic magnesium-protoporphyrin IX monomethyl ester cyclase
MKVLFIYPNAGSQVGFNYGVAHLSGVLKAAGHRTQLWQLCEDIAPLPTRAEFTARLRQSAPDLIGFSVVTNQWPYTRQLAAWARQAVKAPLMVGGIHASVAAADVLQDGLFDYLMVGECEEALLEFVTALGRGEPVTDVRNLGLRVNGQPRVNPVRPMPDLAKLPPKDYEIFDFQKLIDAKHGWVGLMASRGCPFNCSYCFNHFMVKKYRHDLDCSFKGLNYIRHFPVDAMIAEIRHLLERYRNITMFIFDDDLFTYDPDYVRAFCAAYRQVTDLPFVVNGHVGFFDAERAAALAAARCKIVKFGVESGSPRIRKTVMNRHMTNDKIVEAIQAVERAGMHSSCFLMIGLPQETREDVMATVRLMARAVPGRFRWTFFFPFPGTDSYQLAADGGYIDFAKMRALSNFTDDSCLEFGAEQNLFLAKVGRIMPWFVNAETDFEVASVYRQLVDEILTLDGPAWDRRAPGLLDEDKQLSLRFQREEKRHYAVKYNPFMGVISDYFLNER